MVHELKILPEYFEAVCSGEKTFEIRKEDRIDENGNKILFQPGDILSLKEFKDGEFTKRSVKADVKYVLRGEFCKEGYCAMSIMVRGMNYIQGVPVMLRDDEPKEQEKKMAELDKMFWSASDFMDNIELSAAMECVHKWLGLI